MATSVTNTKTKTKRAPGSNNTKKKLVGLLIFSGILMLVLALRLTQVMLINGPDLQKKALTQWTKRTTLSAQRGRIVDRNGLVLAQSGTAYRVLANPPAIAEEDRVRIAIEVSDVLDLDYDYVLERISDTKRKQVQLKRQVETSVVDQLTALQLGDGISFTTDKKRYYPFGQLFAQIIGFTGIDGEGQTGLEAEYDTYLAGENGRLVSEVDRKGNALSYGSEQYVAPVDGYDMTLTVDSVIQSYLEKYVEECQNVNRGITTTGLVMNPQTGEILAMATYPSFDLNNPPRDQVTELMSMSRNRAVTDTFEPGSIFKVVTLAAALDSGATVYDPDKGQESVYECKGYKTFRLEKIRCWKTGGHGKQTLSQAVQNSCNCAFMEMAASMGVNTFYDYIYAFGFEESTECGLPQEDTGKIVHRKYIRESDLARVAFGQTMTCTGIQICSAVSAAVNGGILMKPYIVDNITATDGTVIQKNEPTELRRVISAETSRKVREILKTVVDKGSGSNAQVIRVIKDNNGQIKEVKKYAVGGKTGTAQKYEDDGTASRTRLIASFVGFIPADDPKYVCLVTIDEPQVPVVYGSTVAAPWVGKIFSELVQYEGIQPEKDPATGTDVAVSYAVVPDYTNQTASDAEYKIGHQFDVYVTDSEKAGIVTAQVPAGGEVAPANSKVVIYTNLTNYNDEGVAVDKVKVPNLLKKRRQEAYDTCAKLGLTISFDLSRCTGLIDTQSIAEGTEVDPGTDVFVTFYDQTLETVDPETGAVITPAPQTDQ
jgi:stage V sporulation protein D (sporulation-specific penicillin-binding protein)